MDDWKTRITKVKPLERPPGGESEEACLVLIYPPGGDLGRRYELVGLSEMTIGRGSDCDIQVDRDSVSRRHARLVKQNNAWTVIDLGSTNGSYVNDIPINERTLREGDLLRIGNAIFKFLTGGNVESQYHEEIYRMTIIDGLTQAYNKRYFLENLERELARCTRHGRPLSLLLFDIDHFKNINDEHGHLTGDFVLRELARRVKARVRRDEILARYGGEEFAVIMPETTKEQALKVGEDLRIIVCGTPFDFEGDAVPVSVSVGVSVTQVEIQLDAFVRTADENLYKAKRSGRNRVVG